MLALGWRDQSEVKLVKDCKAMTRIITTEGVHKCEHENTRFLLVKNGKNDAPV